jgi:hypothetical protein
MRKGWSLVGAVVVVCLMAVSASADVSDYLGDSSKSSKCPKVIVIRPELSEKNVFYPVDAPDLETASNMIGSAVASKYEGSAVFSAKELKDLKACNVPVVLTKLKSYTKEPAIFGQFEGKASVTILHFRSTGSDAPDKEVEVSATGERHWGESVPFLNAIQAVCAKIQKKSL